MKTLHKNDWTSILKILAAIIATILGAVGADSCAEELNII